MTDNATGIDAGSSRDDHVDADNITIDCDKEITPRLVIAIKFGTYACSYALQWRSDYENANCIESIKVPTHCSSFGFCTRKTPSYLLLKPDKSIAEFGYKADFQFSKNKSLPERKRPKDWKDWYFFRFFKMRLYTGEAGINGKNLSIAFESECAALYCTKVPLEKIKNATGNNERTEFAAPGQTLMIVDMGCDTVDITTVKINEDKTIQQVYKSCGGPWGGKNINEKFEMFLVRLIGAETVREFIEKHEIDYYNLRMDFESRKREMKGSDDQIPVKLPDSLRQLWERAEGKEIDDILEEKKGFGEIEYMTGRLFLEAKIIHMFFQEIIGGLLKYINEEVLSEMCNVSINSIILVGGFAESSYVMQYMRESLRSHNIPVVRPHLPDLAVLNGAVLFGQNEKIVKSIILRHSYGIAMTMEFVPNKHKDDEKYELDNMIMANNVFRKHATIGQTVPTNEWICSKKYYPEKEGDIKTTFFIFTSDSVDPVHTTEKGCKYIGQVDVDFGYNSDSPMRKAVKVEFKFGATELKVRAVTSTSSKQHVNYFNLH